MKKFLFLLLLPVLVKAQDKVYISYFEVINMNKGYQYSTTRLLKSYMEDENKYTLVLGSKPDSNFVSESLEEAKAKATSYGAKYFILGELNRISENVLVSVAMYNTADGGKIWFDKLMAKNPDDLSPIMLRIAKTIGTSNKAAAVDDIYYVTESESAELQKKNSNNYFGIGIGGAVPFTALPTRVLSGAEIIWSMDARNLLLEIKGQGYWSNRTHVIAASVEIYYPFHSTSKTFFAGGGLAMSGVADNRSYSYSVRDTNYYYGGYYYYDNYYSGPSGSGLMFLAGGGYIFNRTSSTQIRLYANGFVGMYNVTDRNNAKEIPIGAILKMDILF